MQDLLDELCVQIINSCDEYGWRIDEKIKAAQIVFICYTPVGKIRISRWNHNGEYGINIFDRRTVKKFEAYMQGRHDQNFG